MWYFFLHWSALIASKARPFTTTALIMHKNNERFRLASASLNGGPHCADSGRRAELPPTPRAGSCDAAFAQCDIFGSAWREWRRPDGIERTVCPGLDGLRAAVGARRGLAFHADVAAGDRRLPRSGGIFRPQ